MYDPELEMIIQFIINKIDGPQSRAYKITK